MNNFHSFFITCSLLASLSQAIVFDYCVSDYSLPTGPAGYACKDPKNVTTDDFVFTGFRAPGPRDDIFKRNTLRATAENFPGLNGLEIAMSRLDLDVNGVIPMHSHRTSEVIVLIEGKIIAGFIDTNNTAYYKVLEVYDVMIFPQFLLHFQVNVGDIPALAFVALNSANPGFQTTSNSLFEGNLPADLVEKTMYLDHDEVIRLKGIFGGSAIKAY